MEKEWLFLKSGSIVIYMVNSSLNFLNHTYTYIHTYYIEVFCFVYNLYLIYSSLKLEVRNFTGGLLSKCSSYFKWKFADVI